MKTLLLTITYLAGTGELMLAIYFFVTNSKNEIRRVMALLSFSTGIWSILSAATSYSPYSTMGFYGVAGSYFFGALLVIASIHLSIVMPYPPFRFDTLHAWLLYLPVAIFGYIIFFSKTIVASFSGTSEWSGVIIGGPLFGLYNIYFLINFLLVLGMFSYRLRNTEGVYKRNIRVILWAYVLGGLPAAVQYFFIATINPDANLNTLVGVVPTVLWVGGVSYILLKK